MVFTFFYSLILYDYQQRHSRQGHNKKRRKMET